MSADEKPQLREVTAKEEDTHRYKADRGKDRWDAVPWSGFRLIVKAFTVGAGKYLPFSWADRVDNAEARYFAATQRHLSAYAAGERHDRETGLPHLAHAGASLLILLTLSENLDLPPWAERD